MTKRLKVGKKSEKNHLKKRSLSPNLIKLRRVHLFILLHIKFRSRRLYLVPAIKPARMYYYASVYVFVENLHVYTRKIRKCIKENLQVFVKHSRVCKKLVRILVEKLYVFYSINEKYLKVLYIYLITVEPLLYGPQLSRYSIIQIDKKNEVFF